VLRRKWYRRESLLAGNRLLFMACNEGLRKRWRMTGGGVWRRMPMAVLST